MTRFKPRRPCAEACKHAQHGALSGDLSKSGMIVRGQREVGARGDKYQTQVPPYLLTVLRVRIPTATDA